MSAEERTLKGSYLGSCVPSRDIPAYIAFYQQGRLPVDRLLAERLTLTEINADSIGLRAAKRCGKSSNSTNTQADYGSNTVAPVVARASRSRCA